MRARQSFQRILHVRPTHQAANERMAELFFIDGLQAEGLRHFDRLVQPPEFPIIDFRAAGGCLITGRFDQGAELAKRFLRRTEDDGLMDGPRAKARLIRAECLRLAKANRHLARQANLLRRRDERAAPDIRHRDGRVQPTTVVQREPAAAVRNTRAHIDLKLPKRIAATIVVRPESEEANVLDALAAVIRDSYAGATAADRWRMTTLQMQAGSGPAALRFGLRDHAGRTEAAPFAAVVAALDRIGGRSAKVEALIDLTRRSQEKTIVFTRFRATLDELEAALTAAGYRVSVFHGGLSSADKQRAVDAFADDAAIPRAALNSRKRGSGDRSHDAACLRGDDGKAPAAARAIDGEVLPIERKDLRQRFALGDANEGRVSEVHRQVAVLLHQLAHAGCVGLVERRQRKGLRLQPAPERLLASPRFAQEIHRLGEYRPDRDERVAEDLQRRNARPVLPVAPVEECNERTGINEDAAHGPVFEG